MIEAVSILFSIAVLLSIFNWRFLKMPSNILLFIIGIVVAVAILVTKDIFPSLYHFMALKLEVIDFESLLLDGFLGFLLFAGAIHVDLKALDCSKWSVLLFATLGVFITAGIVGTALYYIAPLLGVEIPYMYALLFGALIAPTDPIAVLAILEKYSLSKSLLVKFKAESLFNDGIGVILFAGMMLIIKAINTGNTDMVIGDIGLLFLKEVGGGLAFGAILGIIGFKLIRLLHEKPLLATMVSLAIVAGGYAVSHVLHISGPLAMVEAGLIIGSKIRIDKVCERLQTTITGFWEMVDKILNAIVFLLMGLLILLVDFNSNWLLVGGISIIIALVARYAGIIIPFAMLGHTFEKNKKTAITLTWGGLRGGISIALALGVSDEPYGQLILFITISVVCFSIIVQGLTVGKVHKMLEETGENS